MELVTLSGAISNISPEGLREYLAHHDEREFALIDVRERDEYAAGHIPGALLLPLSEFDTCAEQLCALRERKLIFYCRSGGRSTRAASIAALGLDLPEVFNLRGGMMAWNGYTVADFPRIRALDARRGFAELLRQAINMEKGAFLLYQQLARHFGGTAVEVVVAELGKAEAGHARLVYSTLAKHSQQPLPAFEAYFDAMPGDIVESGESFGVLSDLARKFGANGSLELLEMALELELSAYELYKHTSLQATLEQERRVLSELATQEKRHADSIFRSLERMASEASS